MEYQETNNWIENNKRSIGMDREEILEATEQQEMNR